MADLFVNNVKQISETAGTGAFSFTGIAPGGYVDFDSQMNNGDRTVYAARDSSGAWEVGIGTFNTGPITMSRSLLASSTGSLISWPGSPGEIEIIGAMHAGWLDDIFMDTTLGFLARTADHTFAARELKPGTYVTWTNPKGTAGDPTLVDTKIGTDLLHLTVGSTIAQRTALNTIIFAASATGFTGHSGGSHFFIGQSSEILGSFHRVAANDYRLRITDNVTTKEAVVVVAPANPGDDGKLVVARSGRYLLEELIRIESDTLDDDTTTSNGVLAGLSKAITIPNDGGVWDLKVDLLMHYRWASGTSQIVGLEIDLERDLDAGGYNPVARFANHNTTLGSPTINDEPIALNGIWHGYAQTAGVHTFRINIIDLHGEASLKSDAGNMLHRLIITAMKVAG